MATNEQRALVCVTGATGFVALHVVRRLLAEGRYRVRGTVRNRASKKCDALRALPGASERLELVEADLLDGVDKWTQALNGCSFVMHVASPVPVIPDEKTIETAVEGTTSVLAAAALVHSPKIKKVVLTSSCVAINDGHSNVGNVFDETFWTRLDSKKLCHYARSKTLAEKAAWELWSGLTSDTRFALTVLHPTLIVGPVLSDAENGSAGLIARMMSLRTYPAAPRASVGIVDVRDVAEAHLHALERSESDGQRILLTATPTVRFREMAKWLKAEFGPLGYTISTVETPTWLLRLYVATGVDRQAKFVLHRCGAPPVFNNDKSRRLLGLRYRCPRVALLDMAHSLIAHRMLAPSAKYTKRAAAAGEKAMATCVIGDGGA